VISGAVQIGLMLPMLYYFHRISVSGLTANLLVVPALSLVVPFGFAAIFTGWYLPAAIARQLLQFSAWVVEFHVEWEPLLRIPSPPLWIAVGYSAALLFALWPGRFRFVRTVPAVAMLVVLVWHPLPPRITPGELELTAVDVGQGESLFVALPSGKLLLMDGGGIPSYGRRSKPRLDIGEDVVAPYLWSRSIRRVDVIALSHAHEDHAGGLPALIENFRPAELWMSRLPLSQEAIARAAQRAGTKVVTLEAGRRIDYGGVTFDVLSPPSDYEFAQAGKNDDSLVLRLQYGAHTFLLTGDIERRMEQRLLETGDLGRIDVLKVAHHGSRTSTALEFVDATRPLFALISVGAANAYRHPHTQVLENLSSKGAAILRTDLSGLVTVRSDGKRFTIDTAQWAVSTQPLESPF
jgi:competence protein ComEC